MSNKHKHRANRGRHGDVRGAGMLSQREDRMTESERAIRNSLVAGDDIGLLDAIQALSHDGTAEGMKAALELEVCIENASQSFEFTNITGSRSVATLFAVPLLIRGGPKVSDSTAVDDIHVLDAFAKSFRAAGMVSPEGSVLLLQRLVTTDEFDEMGWSGVAELAAFIRKDLGKGRMPNIRLAPPPADIFDHPSSTVVRDTVPRLLVGFLVSDKVEALLDEPLRNAARSGGALDDWQRSMAPLLKSVASRIGAADIQALAPQPLYSAVRSARLSAVGRLANAARDVALQSVCGALGSLMVCVSQHENMAARDEDEEIYGRIVRVAFRSRLDGTFLGGFEVGPSEFRDSDGLSDLVVALQPEGGLVVNVGGPDEEFGLTSIEWDDGIWPAPILTGLVAPFAAPFTLGRSISASVGAALLH